MSNYTTYKPSSSDPSTKDIVQMQVTRLQNTSAHISTSTTSRLYSGLEVNITPRFQDSTLMIKCTSNMTYGRTGTKLMWSLYRTIDGSGAYSVYDTRSGENFFGWSYASYNAWAAYSTVWYEQPNTTSQVNYKVYYNEYTSSTVAYFCHRAMDCFLQVMEIKA